MFTYQARLGDDGEGGYLVTFPDVPEAITGGATLKAALEMAEDALECALLTYVELDRPLPAAATPPGKGLYPVAPRAEAVAKLAVIDAFKKAGISKAEFGRRISKKDMEVKRILDPHHRTKLAPLERAAGALGKRLVITVVDRDDGPAKRVAAA